MTIATSTLAEVVSLYDQGRYLQALEAGKSLGPLRQWKGTAGRLLAGRLAANLNASRLASALFVRAWRADRTDPEACYFYGRTLLERWGPYAAWCFLNRRRPLDVWPGRIRAHWLGLQADVLARLRDFDRAHAQLAAAENLAPDDPWIAVERAAVLELADKYDPALAAAKKSLAANPWYRPGVMMVAHLLQLCGQDRQARDLLSEAAKHLESVHVLTQLADLSHEMGDAAAARRVYDEIAERFPALEPGAAKAILARRTYLAYLCHDFPVTIALAKEFKDPFFVHLVETCENGAPQGHRVLLPVGFVRQHHMTCSPATLSAISRFWEMPTDHLGLAEEICYDGTPPAKERQWVEDHGWLAREFTVTWESAVALIDRGIPFTLMTVEPTSAHLQAVIGYDSCCRTLLVRDPFVRNHGEFLVDTFLTRYQSTGPRGMALVPRDKAELLAGLALPDERLYDQVYDLQRALLAHRRGEALALYRAMRGAAGEHRLVLLARRLIAAYDGNEGALLKSTERLLKLYPGDPVHCASRIASLRQLGRKEARLEAVKQLTNHPLLDPVFRLQLAHEIGSDARRHGDALRLLRNVLRRLPGGARGYSLLATIRSDQRKLEEATELHRFASSLDPWDEQLSWAYFRAARAINRTDEAMQFLTRRVERLGHRSGRPALTLFAAYRDVDRMSEGFEVLESALKARTDDADLQLGAADAWAHAGLVERATKILSTNEQRSRRGAWLRTAASVARADGDLAKALRCWQEVLIREPLSMDAQVAVARLLAETTSVPAAIEHLRRACRRFPNHFGLHRLLAEWSRDVAPAERATVLRQMIRIDPSDAWTRRELVVCLSREREFTAARAEAAIATQLDPSDTNTYGVRGWLEQAMGNDAEAKREYRHALRLSIDNQFAMHQWFYLCASSAERREILDELHSELRRQVTFGDGLLTFAELSRGASNGGELLAILREGWEARPDLWHAWSGVIRQLRLQGQSGEALDLANRATEQFPLLPGAWRDLADVHRDQNDIAGQLRALERARELNPQWSVATRQLADAYEAAGDTTRARGLHDQAIARDPLEALNHEALALFFWRQAQPDAALEKFSRAVELDPGNERAWQSMQSCAATHGKNRFVEDLARMLTQHRPDEARSWLNLARCLTGPECLEEQLTTIDRAIELDDRGIEAYDIKATVLAESGQYDAALATCRPVVFGDQVPLRLRGRAAWVTAKRGDLRGAIQQMTGIVAEDQEYAWGWHSLMLWHDQLADRKECVVAAEALVRISPHDVSAHNNLGLARRAAGDHEGAKRAFARVLDLDPKHSTALPTLVELHLGAEGPPAAESFLAALEPFADRAAILAQRVVVAAKRGRQQDASAALAQLCTLAGDNSAALRTALDSMVKRGWQKPAQQTLELALADPSVNPEAAGAWAALCMQQRQWKRCLKGLDQLRAWPRHWNLACTEFLEQLNTAIIKPNNRFSQWSYRCQIARFARKNNDLISADTKLWSLVGRTFIVANRAKAIVRFMSGWRGRADVQPWALANLAYGLARMGRYDECFAVSRHALTLPPDGATSLHQLWLAIDDVLSGRFDTAHRRMQHVTIPSGAFYHALAALVQGMLALDQARKDSPKRIGFWRSTRILRGKTTRADREQFVANPALRKLRRGCLKRIRHDTGSYFGYFLARLSS